MSADMESGRERNDRLLDDWIERYNVPQSNLHYEWLVELRERRRRLTPVEEEPRLWSEREVARTRKVEEAVVSALFDHNWLDLAAILNDYRSRLETLEAPDVEE